MSTDQKMNPWTEEERQDCIEKYRRGEMTEEDRIEMSYQYFARQDNGNLATLEALFKDLYGKIIFDGTKQMAINGYRKRYAELSTEAAMAPSGSLH